jgi:serine/threonine protein kinase
MGETLPGTGDMTTTGTGDIRKSDLMTGRVVGPYRVVRRIGVGGMGTVYVAEHLLLERLVALKVLAPLSAEQPEAIDRFLLEARSASRIRHPNVVEVFDLGQSAEGHVYIAMELLEGADLEALLASEGALPWQRARDIGMQIAAALGAAHAGGIIHRDLTPQNVFIERRYDAIGERVKLLDFGVAKQMSANAPRLTRGGLVCGTPGYMAPEQIEERPVDQRVDIYSLGCVLYHMLTGATPFRAESTMAMLRKQVEGRVLPPSLAGARPIPPALDALVLRALHPDPAHRWPDAGSIHEALAACEAPLPDDRATPVAGQPRPPELVDIPTRAARATNKLSTPISTEIEPLSDLAPVRTGIVLSMPAPPGMTSASARWGLTIGIGAALATTLIWGIGLVGRGGSGPNLERRAGAFPVDSLAIPVAVDPTPAPLLPPPPTPPVPVPFAMPVATAAGQDGQVGQVGQVKRVRSRRPRAPRRNDTALTSPNQLVDPFAN